MLHFRSVELLAKGAPSPPAVTRHAGTDTRGAPEAAAVRTGSTRGPAAADSAAAAAVAPRGARATTAVGRGGVGVENLPKKGGKKNALVTCVDAWEDLMVAGREDGAVWLLALHMPDARRGRRRRRGQGANGTAVKDHVGQEEEDGDGDRSGTESDSDSDSDIERGGGGSGARATGAYSYAEAASGQRRKRTKKWRPRRSRRWLAPCLRVISTMAPPRADTSLHIPITAVAFSPADTRNPFASDSVTGPTDGASQLRVAVGNAKGTVLVFSVARGVNGLELRGPDTHHSEHQDFPISHLAWSPDGAKLYSACLGGAIYECSFAGAHNSMATLSLSNFASFIVRGVTTALVCRQERPVTQLDIACVANADIADEAAAAAAAAAKASSTAAKAAAMPASPTPSPSTTSSPSPPSTTGATAATATAVTEEADGDLLDTSPSDSAASPPGPPSPSVQRHQEPTMAFRALRHMRHPALRRIALALTFDHRLKLVDVQDPALLQLGDDEPVRTFCEVSPKHTVYTPPPVPQTATCPNDRTNGNVLPAVLLVVREREHGGEHKRPQAASTQTQQCFDLHFLFPRCGSLGLLHCPVFSGDAFHWFWRDRTRQIYRVLHPPKPKPRSKRAVLPRGAAKSDHIHAIYRLIARRGRIKYSAFKPVVLPPAQTTGTTAKGVSMAHHFSQTTEEDAAAHRRLWQRYTNRRRQGVPQQQQQQQQEQQQGWQQQHVASRFARQNPAADHGLQQPRSRAPPVLSHLVELLVAPPDSLAELCDASSRQNGHEVVEDIDEKQNAVPMTESLDLELDACASAEDSDKEGLGDDGDDGGDEPGVEATAALSSPRNSDQDGDMLLASSATVQLGRYAQSVRDLVNAHEAEWRELADAMSHAAADGAHEDDDDGHFGFAAGVSVGVGVGIDMSHSTHSRLTDAEAEQAHRLTPASHLAAQAHEEQERIDVDSAITALCRQMALREVSTRRESLTTPQPHRSSTSSGELPSPARTFEEGLPPRDLTDAVYHLVLQVHARTLSLDVPKMLCQWMRLFSPLNLKHRKALLQYRVQEMELVTLYFWTHTSWHYLRADGSTTAMRRAAEEDSRNASHAVEAQSDLSTLAAASARMDGKLELMALKLDLFSSASSAPLDESESLHAHNGTGPAASSSSSAAAAVSGSCATNAAAIGASGCGVAAPTSTHGSTSVPANCPMQWDERTVIAFVRRYGAYLQLDAAVAAMSAVKCREGLTELLGVAMHDEDMQAGSQFVDKVVRSKQPSVSGARELITAIFAHTSSSFSTPVCLVIRHLGALLQRTEHMGIELCVALFPILRPWNVRVALFGDLADRPVRELTTRSTETALADEQSSQEEQQAKYKYHRYLTRLMRSRVASCGKDNALVTEWLELSLLIGCGDPTSTAAPAARPGTSSSHDSGVDKRRRFLVSVRHIIRNLQTYRCSLRDAIQLCHRYGFWEGVVEMTRQLSVQLVRQSASGVTVPIWATQVLPQNASPRNLDAWASSVQCMPGIPAGLDLATAITDASIGSLRASQAWELRTAVRIVWSLALLVSVDAPHAGAQLTAWLEHVFLSAAFDVTTSLDAVSPSRNHSKECDKLCTQLAERLARALCEALGPRVASTLLAAVPCLLSRLNRAFIAELLHMADGPAWEPQQWQVPL